MSLRYKLPTILSLVALGSAMAHPQLSTNTYDTSPVVVYATRRPQPPTDIPAATTVITATELKNRGSLNVVEALRDLGGLQFRSLNANPSQTELTLRGFGENAHGRVLVLRDGQRMNQPDMDGINWLQLPISAIERIEILEGAHSALYGNHAIGGVINIITDGRSPQSLNSATAYAASHGTYGASLLRHQNLEGNLYNVGADWQRSNGYRHNGDYDALNLRIGLLLPINSGLQASVRASYDRIDSGLPGSLAYDAMKANPRQTTSPRDKAENDTYNAGVGLVWQPTPDQEANLSLRYNRNEVDSKYFNMMSFSTIDIDTIMAALNHRIDSSLMEMPLRLLAGVDFEYDRLKAMRYGDAQLATPLLSGTVDRNSTALHLNGELEITDKTTLALGGRVERARYSADIGGSSPVDSGKSHTSEALSAALLYRPVAKLRLYSSLATVYRLPFLDEQVSYYGYGGDRLYEDLDPEKGYSTELGAVWEFLPGWEAALNAYHMRLRDEVAYNMVTFQNDNLDKTRHQGASAALKWSDAQLGYLRLRYRYNDASFRSGYNSGKDIPLVSRHYLAATASANLPAHLSLQATVNFSGSQYLGGDNANTNPRLSSHATLDLALRYSCPAIEGLGLLVGVDNVLDKKHASTAYLGYPDAGYYPAPGRTFKTMLNYEF